MILNETIRAHMSEATRALMSGGAAAATAAIQEALKGMPGHMGKGNAAPRMPDVMRNMDLSTGKSFPSHEGIPDFVTDLLARLGVPSSQDRWTVDKHLWDPEPQMQPVDEPEAKNGGQFLTEAFTNHAGTRDYKVYIPSSYQGQTLPLVVMLHGCTQNPDDFAAGTGMNVLAEKHQCFVVYPAQAPAANGSKCWNWFNAADQHRDQGEPSIIAGITRRIIGTYPVDARRVYVAGLSAGGAMAATMGMTYPDLYAAVGVHSGLPYAVAHDLPSALTAMKEGGPTPGRQRDVRVPGAERGSVVVPTIVFHGDRDTKVHPRNGDQVIAQWTTIHARDGAHNVTLQRGQVPDGHAYTRAIYHDASGQAILEQWSVHGAGHAWSGGSSSGSYTDPKGPDAAKEMIRFFYEHPRREPERTYAERAAGPAGHGAQQQPQ